MLMVVVCYGLDLLLELLVCLQRFFVEPRGVLFLLELAATEELQWLL
jgi:hypothetical protein